MCKYKKHACAKRSCIRVCAAYEELPCPKEDHDGAVVVICHRRHDCAISVRNRFVSIRAIFVITIAFIFNILHQHHPLPPVLQTAAALVQCAPFSLSSKQQLGKTVWFLVGNGGMDYGDYYWGLYKDCHRDPFPHSYQDPDRRFASSSPIPSFAQKRKAIKLMTSSAPTKFERHKCATGTKQANACNLEVVTFIMSAAASEADLLPQTRTCQTTATST